MCPADMSDLSPIEQAVRIGIQAGEALASAPLRGVDQQPVGDFPLDGYERVLVAELVVLPTEVRERVLGKGNVLTLYEVARLQMAIADGLLQADPKQRLMLLSFARRLSSCLDEWFGPAGKVGIADWNELDPAGATVFQFKVTLLGVKPPVWRRIVVPDCTLARFHEYLQSAMGWNNSHLHQYEIEELHYGDPELLGVEFDEEESGNTTEILLSEVIPMSRRRFAFHYEYDLGEGWDHEILFEGNPEFDPQVQYPHCIEGARACPPEDCGGARGYTRLVAAYRDPRHDQHKEMRTWLGPAFDPEQFDPLATTGKMRKGLTDSGLQ
ncbi:MAG TPA: hypothetical protein DDY91_10130 [Planctomycetaceae bacterium]|nr:hypothetical protein [Planctomycetaceae bacterium]